MARAMGIPEADKAEDFLTALIQLQKPAADGLKMSDYGFAKEEALTWRSTPVRPWAACSLLTPANCPTRRAPRF